MSKNDVVMYSLILLPYVIFIVVYSLNVMQSRKEKCENRKLKQRITDMQGTCNCWWHNHPDESGDYCMKSGKCNKCDKYLFPDDAANIKENIAESAEEKLTDKQIAEMILTEMSRNKL